MEGNEVGIKDGTMLGNGEGRSDGDVVGVEVGAFELIVGTCDGEFVM